ncbi:MAG: hypothetical protein NTV86_10215 [Planctomycetota bacterium]|nr:hypothetical protein [Planctomycetota bacterium]
MAGAVLDPDGLEVTPMGRNTIGGVCNICTSLPVETDTSRLSPAAWQLTGEGREEKFRTYRYVLIHTATSTTAPLATEWKVQTLPTMVILDSSGNEVRRHEGYIDAAKFWNEFIVPAKAP